VQNQNLKYKCETQWTSDKKVLGMEDRDDSDEGVVAYKECLEWSRELKKLSDTHDYWRLHQSCNMKAGVLGYLKEWGQDVGEDGGGAHEGSRRRQQPETTPSYVLDELDDVLTLYV
jgi:hypothetical protein